MFHLNPQEQLREIQKGVVDLISEKELLEKLTNSYKNKKPLALNVALTPLDRICTLDTPLFSTR